MEPKVTRLPVEKKRPQKPESKVITQKKDTLEDTLSAVFEFRKWPKEDIKKLASLEDTDSIRILSLNNREFLYQFLNLYENLGLLKVTEYFQKIKLSKDAIWNSIIFDPEYKKELLDADILLNRIKVRKGSGKCKRCGSDELLYTELQIRSPDEPPTIFITCLQCQYVSKE